MSTGLHYPRRATDLPCRSCGKPIRPGQLYKPGPCHLGCPPKGRV